MHDANVSLMASVRVEIGENQKTKYIRDESFLYPQNLLTHVLQKLSFFNSLKLEEYIL